LWLFVFLLWKGIWWCWGNVFCPTFMGISPWSLHYGWEWLTVRFWEPRQIRARVVIFFLLGNSSEFYKYCLQDLAFFILICMCIYFLGLIYISQQWYDIFILFWVGIPSIFANLILYVLYVFLICLWGGQAFEVGFVFNANDNNSFFLCLLWFAR